MATSPPQDSPEAVDYIASLARDPFQTALSALLLHYGDMLTGVGLLAAPALVRGIKGRWLTVIAALLSAFGLLTVAGEVLYDFWGQSIGQNLDPDTAVTVFNQVWTTGPIPVLDGISIVGLLGPLLVYAGLARAGVISWWWLAVAVGTMALAFSIPFTPLLFGAITLVGGAPTVWVGLRMVRRTRAEAHAA